MYPIIFMHLIAANLVGRRPWGDISSMRSHLLAASLVARRPWGDISSTRPRGDVSINLTITHTRDGSRTIAAWQRVEGIKRRHFLGLVRTKKCIMPRCV
jgi:hypothetical protein